MYQRECNDCGGSGGGDEASTECRSCNGTGLVEDDGIIYDDEPDWYDDDGIIYDDEPDWYDDEPEPSDLDRLADLIVECEMLQDDLYQEQSP